MTSDFQSRLIYTQSSSAIINEQEPVTVSSTIYAIRFLYPGASQHTSSRIRITCTYRETDQFEAHAGVIERWSDKGWILMDDYTDSVLAFHDEEEFRKRLLNYSHAFILGIPLSLVDAGYVPDFPLNSNEKKKKYDSKKRYYNDDLKTQKEKPKTKKEDNYNKDNISKSDDNDDDDDLDWL